MGILKTIYKDFVDAAHDVINRVDDLAESVYYGYVKKDEYSKKEIMFKFHRLGWAIESPFRSIVRGIKNMWNWRVIVWDDRDFDYSYMNDVMAHKLRNMENFFRSKDTHIADWEEIANEIKEAREIVENLNNGDYEDKIMSEWHEKYPFKGFNFIPCESEKERVEQGLPPRLYEMGDNDGVDADDKHKMFKEKWEEVEAEKKRLKERLFTLFVEKSDRWWD